MGYMVMHLGQIVMSKKSKDAASGGFKTKTRKLQQSINQVGRELSALTKREKKSCRVWASGYHKFMKSADQLADLKVHKTQKESRLRAVIKAWSTETVRLTKERDKCRELLQAKKAELAGLEAKLAMLKEQEQNEIKNVDEIVTQVFDLNATVVRASNSRLECLNRHVFPRLWTDEGGMRSQVSFISSDGLQKVVAMVNTMTLVKGEFAEEALRLIQGFFDRFQTTTKVSSDMQPIFELTRQLLVLKTNFKVGPDLYRFISMELDASTLPELARAQTLLRQSIRSEKTNSYIRMYARTNRNANWEVVPQS